MKKNILINKLAKGLTASLSAILIVCAFEHKASAIDYTTKAINAYDHNGNLISSQVVSDVQYIEVEDLKITPEFYSITAEDGSVVKFTMIPVIGTKNYRLGTADIKWNEKDRCAPISTFLLGQTEVTNALWKAVMGSIPSTNNTGNNYPVESVSWDMICKPDGFLDRLNNIAKNDPALSEMMGEREFCLPNEWEWEYAAKGGNVATSYMYSGSSEIDDVGWFKGNSGATAPTTNEVAQKLPNDLGFYDMTGNVWEICEEKYFRGGTSNEYDYSLRVTRGGAFSTEASSCTNTWRGRQSQSSTANNTGLRLALKNKRLKTETFIVKSSDNSEVRFNMIPVIGTSSYKLGTANVATWPDNEIYSNIPTFYLGETEVTNALWKAVMGTVPSTTNTADRYPVETISWNDICGAGGFLEKLNEKLKDQLSGYEFALPSEFEWEYAARGGNRRNTFRYSGSNVIDEVGWYDKNSQNSTHEVAQLDPNALGFYDMSGNVWEWCSGDGAKLGAGTSSVNNYRYKRGGSFSEDLTYASTTYRARALRDTSYNNGGLRLALKPKK